MPISTPTSYASDLARAGGRFYTQGMPEDTKALNEGVFTPNEFLAQARSAGQEVIDQYHQVLGEFRQGLLFYYFGNLDQISHMMWRPLDPKHPAYNEEIDAPLKDVVVGVYEQLDGVVGYTLERMGNDTTLVVMSDHGFASWRRAFHLNTWLKENGFLAVIDPNLRDDPGLFSNVDWSRTRAYGLGLNGLYVNLRGRERNGIVDTQDRKALMEEIAAKLLAAVDPATGERAVTKAYQLDETYHDHGAEEIGPDIVVGYAKGTRGSNQSALGKVGPDVFSDNTEMWSGDHCMDHESVPGILLTNRPLRRPARELKELAAAILAEFGIEGFPSRKGGAERNPETD
jgi:predicted AlkP superfamily phosphohydrolase/phosphomutase